jgi:1-aminocyclopropane-1-carboxylate deaminase
VLPTSPIQEVCHDLLREKNIRLFIKRDDLLHSEISGNKFRKLKYNLITAADGGHNALLTFGGAYSNHIYAVAAAGKEYGFRTIGIIRGEKYESLNPTLSFAESRGMILQYISRHAYRDKYNLDFIQKLEQQYGRFYLVPEGGTNALALKGCAEIIPEINIPFDMITTSCGTGGTMAGIIAGLKGNKYVLGFPSLKGGIFLKEEIISHIHRYGNFDYRNWHLESDYHFGGYAKFTPELIEFINGFKKDHGIQLDPVYTGKMMYGIFDLMLKGRIPRGTKIIALHTGGLQGIAGFNQRFGHLIQ